MTAEPRDVEDWCGSLVAHEPHPGCSGWPSAEARDFIESAKILAEPYNEKIAALEVRLAASDRENAELRRAMETARLVRDDAEGELDEANAQLAAAQAQLAEARRECGHQRAMRQAISDEFQRYILGALVVRDRLMAARRALIGTGYFTEDEVGPDIAPRIIELLAALSAAPQPEPDENACRSCGIDNPVWFAPNEVWNAVMGDHTGFLCPRCFIVRAEASGIRPTAWVLTPEPPASDEPARCEGFSWIGQSLAHCDACGQPYWEHTHDRQHRPGAKLFAADSEVLVPITPEQAAAAKRKWCPTCSGPTRETVGMVCQTCGTDYGPAASGTPDAECRHCGGSGNAHTFDGDDLGICGTCHGTGSAAGGGL